MLMVVSSIWSVLWILAIPGIAMAGWVFLAAWKKRRWYFFFDPKHNQGFPTDAGDFSHHWKSYEGLAKLCITLSAGAVAFLINLLVNQSNSSSDIGQRIIHVAPLVVGFFGASIFLLIIFLLWMTYCYEQYSHSARHDTYRAWKYAVTQSLGWMGFIAFLFGFIWLGSYVFTRPLDVRQTPPPQRGLQATVPPVSSSSGATFVPPNAALSRSTPSQNTGSFFGWFFSDKSVAAATWGLVLVTFLLVIDGFRKSWEQGRQWREEKQRRIDDSKPNAVVEVAAKESTPLDMCFACFNLGNNTFYIDKMIVTASDGKRSMSDLTPQIVIPGTWVTIDYDPAELLGMFGENTPYKEANCVLHLRGATGVVATEPEWFYVGYGKGRADWHKGRLADRQPGVIPPQHKILRIGNVESSSAPNQTI